ncbi:hypothetical protein EMPG_12357 [Blastomyces silverae]|uniref:Uncharacterized protein n=1 Tax=Blastomyces silverae TaxID=2060906 RepID=A0A0H1BNN7_9EURO|nr:hypothetical protein EMPG_12357 [Blastomyces silverae]
MPPYRIDFNPPFVSSVTAGESLSYEYTIEATDRPDGPPNIYLKVTIEITDSRRRVLYENGRSISLASEWRAGRDDSYSAKFDVDTGPLLQPGFMEAHFQFEERNETGSTMISEFETYYITVYPPIMNGTDDE